MSGIACAGHWVLDHIKFIDNWPNLAEQCKIHKEIISNGGGAFNVLADFANLKTPFPLYGIGCIGEDTEGKKILDICRKYQLGTELLHVIPNQSTSYTDVMTIESTGVRTMFHCSGANSVFAYEHVPIDLLKQKKVKLFYLGHLLLMQGLEKKDPDFKLTAAKLLHDIQQAGMETALDIATEQNPLRYKEIVLPCLPYVDHFIINELEAEKISGHVTRKPNHTPSKEGLKRAALFLLEKGIRKNIVIHMPEGAYWHTREAEKGTWYPSFKVPTSGMIATCGAGDAFCAGTLVGIHEGWSVDETLKLGIGTASFSITALDNSSGIPEISTVLKAANQHLPESEIQHF